MILRVLCVYLAIILGLYGLPMLVGKLSVFIWGEYALYGGLILGVILYLLYIKLIVVIFRNK